MKQRVAEHMPMPTVTHEMRFAAEVFDHVLFMDGGVVVKHGRSRQVLSNPIEERMRAFHPEHLSN
jgi:polar amino acid transport system ATP-binding protein